MQLWQEEKIRSKSLSRSMMEVGREEGSGQCPGGFMLSVGLQGAGRAAGLDSVCGSPKCYCLAVRQTPKAFTPLRSKKSGDPVQLLVFLFLFVLCLILVSTWMSGEATFF